MEVSGQLHVTSHFIPRDRATGTHFIGGCVGHRAGLDVVAKIKKTLSLLGIEPW